MNDAHVEQVEPSVVAFIEMHGPYAQMPQSFGTLYGWIAQHGLQPAGMPRGVYFTDPATVPESEAAWEVQAPLGGDPRDEAADENGLGVKHIGAHAEAMMVHRGPYESIAPTYAALGEWVGQHGYAISGPPMEVYLSDPADTKPEDYLTEVRFPVRPV